MNVKPIERLFIIAIVFLKISYSVSADDNTDFKWGGDVRIRNEYREDIQTPASKPPYSLTINDYYRVRSRVWTQIDFSHNIAFYNRLCNEFRYWNKPDMSAKPSSSSYEFPDELFFDNFYLEAKDLFGSVDVRIGRQDISYGNGRIIYDGTPGDGTRSFYFDAIKLSLRNIIQATKIDIFGLYCSSVGNWLSMGNVDRDLTGYKSAFGAKEKDGVDESGAGIYVMNNTWDLMPVDLYWVFKNEEAYYDKENNKTDELNIHTIGFSIKSSFSRNFAAYFENALQIGRRGNIDVSGKMIDVAVEIKSPAETLLSPSMKAGIYYLSGDDPATQNSEEGWNPVFARYTQNQELYVYAYPASWWSNLLSPSLSASVLPSDWAKISFMVEYLFAPENDGPESGHVRGFLSGINAEFDIGKKLYEKKGEITGHIILQILEPGNYYANDETAYFFRWQLQYMF